jgi:hypothetical protein
MIVPKVVLSIVYLSGWFIGLPLAIIGVMLNNPNITDGYDILIFLGLLWWMITTLSQLLDTLPKQRC